MGVRRLVLLMCSPPHPALLIALLFPSADNVIHLKESHKDAVIGAHYAACNWVRELVNAFVLETHSDFKAKVQYCIISSIFFFFVSSLRHVAFCECFFYRGRGSRRRDVCCSPTESDTRHHIPWTVY